jgi:predicted nucleic acid-binding protein
MSARTFCDTNVLVYLVDLAYPEKRAVARSLVERLGSEGQLVTSTQVLLEFYWTSTRKLKVPLAPEEARAIIQEFAAHTVVSADADLVMRALRFSEKHRLSIWDAMIVQAALHAGCQELLSEDMQDGWKIDKLTIKNPFSGQ